MSYDPQDILRATIPYRYRVLQTRVAEDALRNYSARIQPAFAALVRSWSSTENSEWMVRTFVAVKLTLGASLLLASLRFCAQRNVQVVTPYLAYYGMFNAARAWIFTMPHQPWGKEGQLVTMTHEKVINVATDAAGHIDPDLESWLSPLLRSAQASRELFAYRFPGRGTKSAEEHVVEPEEAIEAATLLVELAQANSQLLDRSLEKRYGSGGAQLPIDESFIESAYKYQVANRRVEVLDDDDAMRITQVAIKNGRPWDLALTARPGLVDDFFGAWVDHIEGMRSDAFDPDEHMRIIFDFE